MAGGGADQTLNTTAAFHEITNQRRGGAGGTGGGPDVSMMDDHEPFKCKVPSKVFLNQQREIEYQHEN